MYLTLAITAALAAAPDRPNVLLIVSDDLANTAVGCYGNPMARTPHIDRLAAKGVRSDRAYCQTPLCNPSRTSFLTGLRPDTTRVYDNGTQFRQTVPDAVSLGQTFEKVGYDVARVGKLYHYNVPAGIGTDGLDDPPSWTRAYNPKGADTDDEAAGRIFTVAPNAKGMAKYGGHLSWFASSAPDPDHTDGKIATELIAQLAAAKGKPFFLACGFFRPHTPFVAPKAYFDLFPPDKIDLPQVPAGRRAAGPAAAFSSSHPEQDAMTDAQRRLAIQAYFASTAYMDAQVGRVLEALEKSGHAANTVVVFLSDHGYHLGEHGLWQKQSLFENAARVPLVVYDPRAAKPGVCGRVVELLDLHATLADVCGLPAPKTDGVSLKPLLTAPAAAWDRPAVTRVQRFAGPFAGTAGYSVRTETHRYTSWAGGKHGEQLHDLTADPGERTNLAADPKHAATVAKLKTFLPRM